MLDIKFVRENPEAVKQNIKKKFQDSKLPLVDQVIELDLQSRKAKQQADVLSCFEYVYQCGETTCMDVYVHVGGPAPCAQQAPGGRSQD